MEPAFKRMEAFSAIGYRLEPAEGEPVALPDSGAYWMGKDFSSISQEDFAKLTHPGFVEIAGWIPPRQEGERQFYFFGPVVQNKDFIPEKAAVVDVPAAEYAVFPVEPADSFAELNSKIRAAWKLALQWLEQSAYRQEPGKLAFEYYLSDRTMIYIPVVKA